jgi:hypothetical protein
MRVGFGWKGKDEEASFEIKQRRQFLVVGVVDLRRTRKRPFYLLDFRLQRLESKLPYV